MTARQSSLLSFVVFIFACFSAKFQTMKDRWHDIIFQILIFLFSFQLYLKGLCPTIYVGDSGELTTTAHLLGVAHPSGYPTYILISKFFMFLPIDNIAVRINIVSALFFALSFLLTYQCFQIIGISRLWLIPALLIASTVRVFWEEATVARVYGLNLFFILLLLRLVLPRKISSHHLLLTSFISGLALGNHLQILFTIIPVLVLILIHFRHSLFKILPALMIFFLLGISVYLELPIRSSQNPEMDWENPETLSQFLVSVGRGSYWSNSEGLNMDLVTEELSSLPTRITHQFSIIGFVTSVIGLLFFTFNSPKMFFVLGFTAFMNILSLLMHGSRYDLFMTDRYHIPFFFILFTGTILLIGSLGKRFSNNTFKMSGQLLLLSLVFFSIVRNFAYGNRSQAFVAADLAYNIEASLPHRACIFLLSDGEAFSMAYSHFVGHNRPDITLVHHTGNLFQNSKMFMGLPLEYSILRGQLESRFILAFKDNCFTTDPMNIKYLTSFSCIPYGFIFKYVPNDWILRYDEPHRTYYRNRPIPHTIENDEMAKRIINHLYRRGAARTWEFRRLLEKTDSIIQKINNNEAIDSDITELKKIYLHCGLTKSLQRIDDWKLKNSIKTQ